jgi:predicted nucleotide-binding protein
MATFGGSARDASTGVTPAETMLRGAISAAAGRPVPAVHTADVLVGELNRREWLSAAEDRELRSFLRAAFPGLADLPDLPEGPPGTRREPPSATRPTSIRTLLDLAARHGGRRLKERGRDAAVDSLTTILTTITHLNPESLTQALRELADTRPPSSPPPVPSAVQDPEEAVPLPILAVERRVELERHQRDQLRSAELANVRDDTQSLRESLERAQRALADITEQKADLDRRLAAQATELEALQRGGAGPRERSRASGRKIFVVHGHASGTKEMVARFLWRLTKREPTILHEQPDGGQTVIEKFEAHAAQAAAAVVLLTGDDQGGVRGGPPGDQRPRGRQNVVFELGYFIGALGRSRVIILYEEGVEFPSDLHGIIYVPLDREGAWRTRVAREFRTIGLPVDPDVLFE